MFGTKNLQGYVGFGRFDKFNYFVAGSGDIKFVQVKLISLLLHIWSFLFIFELIDIIFYDSLL